jgi:hypothetical protein
VVQLFAEILFGKQRGNGQTQRIHDHVLCVRLPAHYYTMTNKMKDIGKVQDNSFQERKN